MKKPSLIEALMRSRFLRFGLVGAVGFPIDEGTLALVHSVFGLDPYSGRVISIMTAMTFTWWGNRKLTFAEHAAQGRRGAFGEWLRFVAANSVGAVANYTTYVGLLNFAPAPLNNPYLAVIAGVGVGLIFNFTLSKTLVFRAHRHDAGG